MRIRSVIVLVALLVAPLGACGSDGGGKDLGPYIDAVAADFAEEDEDSPPIDDKQARCAAERAIAAIPEEKVTEYDTPEAFVAATKDNLKALDLDDETLDSVAEAMVDCLGGVDWFTDALADLGLTADQVACVKNAITEADFVASVRADLAGGTSEDFDGKLESCIGE